MSTQPDFRALIVQHEEPTPPGLVSDWLDQHGGEKSWLMAPCLVASGITPDDLAALAASLTPAQFNAGIRWLAATLERLDETPQAGASLNVRLHDREREHDYGIGF